MSEPTFLDYFGGKPKPHILEGRSLSPLLHRTGGTWRQYAISEYDYGTRYARVDLGIPEENARLIMICDHRWKYWHAEGFRPMLFDLQHDPQELNDLRANPDFKGVRHRMHEAIFEWSRRHHNRITRSPEQIEKMSNREPPGILIGVWDEHDYEKHFRKKFSERP